MGIQIPNDGRGESSTSAGSNPERETYGLFRMLPEGPVITFSQSLLPDSSQTKILQAVVGTSDNPQADFFDIRLHTVSQITELFEEIGLRVESSMQDPGALLLLSEATESPRETFNRARKVFEHLGYSQEADPVSLESGTLPQWKKCRPAELIDWSVEKDTSLSATERIFTGQLFKLIEHHLDVNSESNRAAWQTAKQELKEFCGAFLAKVSAAGSSIVSPHDTRIPKPNTNEPVPSLKIFNEHVKRIHPNDPRAHFFCLKVVDEILQKHFSSDSHFEQASRGIINNLSHLAGDLLHKRMQG